MSLFNPWVLLGIFVAIVGSAVAGYSKGQHSERMRQQVEIARLNAEARQKEQALVAAVNGQTLQLVKAQNDAKIQAQKRMAAVDSGAIKLRVPVKATCPVPATADAPVASGNSVQTTAELDRETAKSLIAITEQGDANTRQLNACIDAYNTVYQTLKGTK